jgi:hypothetical protein
VFRRPTAETKYLLAEAQPRVCEIPSIGMVRYATGCAIAFISVPQRRRHLRTSSNRFARIAAEAGFCPVTRFRSSTM